MHITSQSGRVVLTALTLLLNYYSTVYSITRGCCTYLVSLVGERVRKICAVFCLVCCVRFYLYSLLFIYLFIFVSRSFFCLVLCVYFLARVYFFACVCVCVMIKLRITAHNRAIRPCHPRHSMPLALILPRGDQ